MARVPRPSRKQAAKTDAEVVREFCRAWSRCDIQELLGYFTEDGVFHNIPMPPAVGREAIRQDMERFVPNMANVDFEVRNLAAGEGIVMVERVDRFTMSGRKMVLPVVGVFEMEAGKIKAMREYFDARSASGED